MGQLERRVDALEAIAEKARRRELRDIVERLAAARGVSADAIWEHFERLGEEHARLRAAGLSDAEIVARAAARIGVSPEELRRRGREIVDTFGA